MSGVTEAFEHRYRAVQSRDPRFDGWFVTAVTSTGIYCRPSCPARTPRPDNVRFFPNAAAAQSAGFRACRRCRPDAAPCSPEWNGRADAAARALELIADGVVDREGVAGLSRRLGYSVRQLNRLLMAEAGTGALALARARRAATARLLIETTELPMAQVAFAAGFRSIRQFNETIRAVAGVAPSALRSGRGGGRSTEPDSTGRAPVPVAIGVRLAYRLPYAADDLLAFLGARAVEGSEAWAEGAYSRSLRLPHAPGFVTLRPADDAVPAVHATFELDDQRDLATAVNRCRRLLDLDADPVAVDQALGAEPLLAAAVRRSPGLRVPGSVDGIETAVRAVLGQQVSVPVARTIAGRVVATLGDRLGTPRGSVTHLFPTAEALAAARPEDLPVPAARRRAVTGLAAAVIDGSLGLDAGTDRDEARRRLLALPGIGPWTVEYVAMRALGDPDAFPAGDLWLRRSLASLGGPDDGPGLLRVAARWRPWRAYAALHLWRAAAADGIGRAA